MTSMFRALHSSTGDAAFQHSSSKSKNTLVGCCIFNMYQSFLPLKPSNQAFFSYVTSLLHFLHELSSLHQARASDLDSETAKRAGCSVPDGSVQYGIYGSVNSNEDLYYVGPTVELLAKILRSGSILVASRARSAE